MCGVEGLRVGDLQVGPAAVDLQHLQGGVVVGALPGRRQARGLQRRVVQRHRDLAAVRGHGGTKGRHRAGRDHREQGVALGREACAQGRKYGAKRRSTADSRKLCTAGVLSARPGLQHLAVVGKQRDGVQPVDGRAQRHLDLGDDAVGAEGVVHLLDGRAVQLDHARLGLHRHDAAAQQVALVAQHAVGAWSPRRRSRR
jgi:hypothetical protein